MPKPSSEAAIYHTLQFSEPCRLVRNIISLARPYAIVMSQLFRMPEYVGRYDVMAYNNALSSALDTGMRSQTETRVAFLRHRFVIWSDTNG